MSSNLPAKRPSRNRGRGEESEWAFVRSSVPFRKSGELVKRSSNRGRRMINRIDWDCSGSMYGAKNNRLNRCANELHRSMELHCDVMVREFGRFAFGAFGGHGVTSTPFLSKSDIAESQIGPFPASGGTPLEENLLDGMQCISEARRQAEAEGHTIMSGVWVTVSDFFATVGDQTVHQFREFLKTEKCYWWPVIISDEPSDPEMPCRLVPDIDGPVFLTGPETIPQLFSAVLSSLGSASKGRWSQQKSIRYLREQLESDMRGEEF